MSVWGQSYNLNFYIAFSFGTIRHPFYSNYIVIQDDVHKCVGMLHWYSECRIHQCPFILTSDGRCGLFHLLKIESSETSINIGNVIQRNEDDFCYMILAIHRQQFR